PAPQRVVANFLFGRFAERKFDPRELRLGQRVEEITLVLVPIAPAVQLDTACPLHRPRVVTRRDLARAEAVGEGEELGHLDGAVATDARTWRASGEVGFDERLAHLAPEKLAPTETII